MSSPVITTENEQLRQSPFFEVANRSDGALEIRFLTKTTCALHSGAGAADDRINILPERYEEFRLLADRVRNRIVVVTGRGPVEGYFAIGYYAALNGAERVVFEGANSTPRIEMPEAAASPSAKRWLKVEHRSEYDEVSIGVPVAADGKWLSEEINYSSPALMPSANRRVVFTGPGAVSMYLLLGVSAGRAGMSDVCVTKPVVPYAVRFTPVRSGETVALASEKSGVVVGIIGDPNSGKSVFSRAFYLSVRYSMPENFQSWIYDCDLASPTPDWYCAALVDSDENTIGDYKAIRDSMKVKWNSGMELRCARDLGVLRTNLDLVIADLPGGRHKDANGPLLNPVRIDGSPGSRRVDMFRQCDAFILICRKDRRERILAGWTEALAKFGLKDRLVAVLYSSEPNAELSVSPLARDPAGFLVGDLRGLDRKHHVGEIGRRLAEKLGPLIRALRVERS